jgi:putative flippase GtrA
MAVMSMTGLPTVASNAIAVVMVSVASFWVNDRLVFRS